VKQSIIILIVYRTGQNANDLEIKHFYTNDGQLPLPLRQALLQSGYLDKMIFKTEEEIKNRRKVLSARRKQAFIDYAEELKGVKLNRRRCAGAGTVVTITYNWTTQILSFKCDYTPQQ
jgi:hypothetical protein